MSLSTTNIIGFAESVAEFMQNSSDDLASLGISVGDWVTELESKKDSAVTVNDEQEKMKASLKECTDRVETALGELYDTASTKLDAIVGALGKKSEIGKQAARLRSGILRPKTKTEPADS